MPALGWITSKPCPWKSSPIQDDQDQLFVFELLEDGNICLSTFVPGEGEGMLAITIFMIRAEAGE